MAESKSRIDELQKELQALKFRNIHLEQQLEVSKGRKDRKKKKRGQSDGIPPDEKLAVTDPRQKDDPAKSHPAEKRRTLDDFPKKPPPVMPNPAPYKRQDTLTVTLELEMEKRGIQSPGNVLALPGGDCLISCTGCVVRLDSEGNLLGRYDAADPEQKVVNVCTLDNTLFMLQVNGLITRCRNLMGQLSTTPNSDELVPVSCPLARRRQARLFAEEGLEGLQREEPDKYFQAPDVGLLRGGAAITQNAMYLLDFKKGEVSQYVLGDKKKYTFCVGLILPINLTSTGQGEQRLFAVTEWGSHRVRIFSHNWYPLRCIGSQSTAGDSFMSHPTDSVVTEDGRLMVADFDNNRLAEYSFAAKQLPAVRLPGRVQQAEPWYFSICYPYIWIMTRQQILYKLKLFC